jgi:hypothetical protein
MSYGADFANADPANAPLDPTIMIGADPFFWGAILLGLIAALLLGWYLGARSNHSRADAAQAIWKAIHDAARSAMGADDNALKGKAENLLKVIDSRLGKTLGLVNGLSKQIGNLRKAVKGEAEADAHGHSGAHGAGHGAGHGGNHGAHAPAHDAHASHEVHAAPAVTIVNVNAGATAHSAAHPPAEHHPPAHDDKPEKRVLSHREQTDALRLAVAAFNQHWRDEAARVGELRDAHAELSSPGPAHSSSGHGKVSHGGH